MLLKYCFETGKAWDKGLPFVVFAARNAVQESLGLSPAALIFGHSIRGPLDMFKDRLLSTETSSESNVLEFVAKLRDHLQDAHTFAQQAL